MIKRLIVTTLFYFGLVAISYGQISQRLDMVCERETGWLTLQPKHATTIACCPCCKIHLFYKNELMPLNGLPIEKLREMLKQPGNQKQCCVCQKACCLNPDKHKRG